MAREFDMLDSFDRRLLRREPADPNVDTFRSRFAPFGNRIEDVLDEILKQQNDRYIVPGTPRFLDPSKVETRLPPAIGAPMASSGAPPSGAFPQPPQAPASMPMPPPPSAMAAMAQAQPPTGLPPSVTVAPPGIPLPSGAPSGGGIGIGGLPVGGGPIQRAAPLMVGPNGELPQGFRYIDESVAGGGPPGVSEGIALTGKGIMKKAGEAGSAIMDYLGRATQASAPEGQPPPPPPAPSERANLAAKGAGSRDPLHPFTSSIDEVTKRLGRSPLDVLPPGVAEKGLESPGNAASTAAWARAYERAVTDGSIYSVSALAHATKNLNTNLGTNVDPKAIMDQVRSERAPPPAPVSEDAAASGGSEAAAAREVAAARLAQGARGAARAREPGVDIPQPGERGIGARMTENVAPALAQSLFNVSPEERAAHPNLAMAMDFVKLHPAAQIADAIHQVPRVAGGAVSGFIAGLAEKYGLSPAEADRLQRDANILVMGMEYGGIRGRMPGAAPGQPVGALPPPMRQLPAPPLRLPSPTRELPPGFMDQFQQAIQPSRTPMNLGELPPAPPTNRRDAGHYIARQNAMPPQTLEELASGIENSQYLPTAPSERRRRIGHMNRRFREVPPMATEDFQKLIERGWTVTTDGQLVPPGGQ